MIVVHKGDAPMAKRALILCTGNSCRSQMAEVAMNILSRGKVQAVSAGAKPSGYVHPLAIETLRRAQMPVEGLRSKSWDEFKAQTFDYVITVCDRAKEGCPIWPGHPKQIHWSLPDPAEAEGTDEHKRIVFQQIFADITQRIEQFVAGER